MTRVKEIENERGMWLFVAPISGLVLSKDIGEEILIDGIFFVTGVKLPRVRKRLGFPDKISKLKNRGVVDGFFEKSKVYAVGSIGGNGKDKKEEFLNKVRNSLDILSLSQLGYGRRKSNACLSVGREKVIGSSSLYMHNITTKSSIKHNGLIGRFRILNLDSEWDVYHKKYGFIHKLIKLLNGGQEIGNGWKSNIVNAAILAGQSQSSNNLPHAFLWNMIAIETLLTQQGDMFTTELPKRVEAFLGWTTSWSVNNFSEKIKDAYKARCAFVHSGTIDKITIEHLLFTDMLLLNVFVNIFSHFEIFSSKQRLIEFSNKVEAESVLGIDAKVRPKTIRFINPIYSEEDYKTA